MRKALHLGRHDGESLAAVAGPRRLDGRVQRQEVGLRRNAVDELDDVADPLRHGGKALDFGVGPFRFPDRLRRDGRRLRHLPVDLADGGRQLFGRRGYRLHVARGFTRARCDGRCLAGVLGCNRRHFFRGRAHLDDRRSDRLEHAGGVAVETPGQRLHGMLTMLLFLLLGALLGRQPLGPDRVVAEYRHRARHGAHFVAASKRGNVDRQVTAGKALHRLRHGCERTDDPARQDPDRRNADADAEQGDQRYQDELQPCRRRLGRGMRIRDFDSCVLDPDDRLQRRVRGVVPLLNAHRIGGSGRAGLVDRFRLGLEIAEIALLRRSYRRRQRCGRARAQVADRLPVGLDLPAPAGDIALLFGGERTAGRDVAGMDRAFAAGIFAHLKRGLLDHGELADDGIFLADFARGRRPQRLDCGQQPGYGRIP